MSNVRRRLGRRKARAGVGPPERKKGRRRGAKTVWRRAHEWAKGEEEWRRGRRKRTRRRRERKRERETMGRETKSKRNRVRGTMRRKQDRRNFLSDVVWKRRQRLQERAKRGEGRGEWPQGAAKRR